MSWFAVFGLMGSSQNKEAGRDSRKEQPMKKHTIQLSTHLCVLLIAAVCARGETVTKTTIQHATMTSVGATADGDRALFATRWNSYGLDASFLAIDFLLIPADFGLLSINDVASVSISLTHTTAPYTTGRFDVFYVQNTAPSIGTGSTALSYNATYGYGFDAQNPPASLAGLTKVASSQSFVPNGMQSVSVDLSVIEPLLMSKINAEERIRFVFSEAVDTTVASWQGLGSGITSAPAITVTAVPEPTTIVLLATAAVGGALLRRRWRRGLEE